jgi:MraZ protein
VGATGSAGLKWGYWARCFSPTFEKQLDAKRRIVVPQEYRALTSGPFDGVFCFPSIEADCIEAGGKVLFDRYVGVIEELEFGDPIRSALETSVLGGMAKLASTPRPITLPETLCEMFGLSDWVVVVGLGDRFQIWSAKPSSAPFRPARRRSRGPSQSARPAARAKLGGAG